MSVQAFVVELGGRVVVVDPCVGNGKQRALPFWNEQSWPFLERFAAAGFAPARVDAVVHTHLHADHVGWDTRLEGGAWVPTFARARHLYTARELEWAKRTESPGNAVVWDDSIAPILAAGLADVVDEDADLGGGLRLEPTPGPHAGTRLALGRVARRARAPHRRLRPSSGAVRGAALGGGGRRGRRDRARDAAAGSSRARRRAARSCSARTSRAGRAGGSAPTARRGASSPRTATRAGIAVHCRGAILQSSPSP